MVICAASLLVTVYLSQLNGRVDLARNFYNNYFLYIIGALCGCVFCIFLAQFCSQNALLSHVGRNTLTIFSLHLAALSVIKGVITFVFHVNPAVLVNSITYNIALAVVAIIVLLPIAYVLNRYFPFFLGKAKKQSRMKVEFAPHPNPLP